MSWLLEEQTDDQGWTTAQRVENLHLEAHLTNTPPSDWVVESIEGEDRLVVILRQLTGTVIGTRHTSRRRFTQL